MKSLAINRERLFQLFKEMVDIYSPSGKEEEITDYLENVLVSHNLPVTRQLVEGARYNLIVSGSPSPETLFLGHVDTVPAYDIEKYDFSLKGDQCFGLGTADMKSGCAAMIEAFITAHDAGVLPDHAALALVVGEEETGDGTIALLKSYRFKQAVVAEPSELNPCLSHYGYVELNARAFGYRRHAAMSGRDTNAIRAMLHLLLELEEYVEVGDSGIVMNIRDLHSSEAGFAVPDRCAASIDLHIPPAIPAREFAEKLRIFAEDKLLKSGATRFELDFPTMANGYEISAQHSFVGRIQQVYQALKKDWAPIPFNSHSDANLLDDAGCAAIVLGPGQLAKAHTRDESIHIEQLFQSARIYSSLLQLEYDERRS